jgi:Ca-activated chloride channel family protein
LRAPSDPGQYEVRYILGQDNKILARASVTILGVVAQVEAPETANVAAEFKVSWQGPNNSGDYISIALPEGEGSAYTAYTYTEEGTPLQLLAPSDPGRYEVRYILGQDNKILAKTPITIASVKASVQPPASVPAGASFQVDWLGPSAEGDYITVASSQSEADQYDNYAYTQDGNPAKLRAPAEPGRYETRYILGHGGKLLAAAAIEVTAVSASVAAPVEVAAEARFTVEWQGPGYPGDHVTIAEPEAAGDEYASYIYTEGGTSGELTAPAHAGLYEVRYIMDSGKKILGKTTITVK